MKKFFFILVLLTQSSLILYSQSESYVCDSLIDTRDGRVYKTVKIGTQIWMAENLAYLPSVSTVAQKTFKTKGVFYYVYDYDGLDVNAAKATSNYVTYGVLYNWPAAMASSESSSTTPSGVKGVCPEGWHLPSSAEWILLIDYLGGNVAAGGKLKEIDTSLWKSPNGGATNESNFSALPGGCRYYKGSFENIGLLSYWWTATENNSEDAIYQSVGYGFSNMGSYNYEKEMGFSVRCVKD